MPLVRIYPWIPQAVGGQLNLDTNQRLHRRGSDVRFFANTGYIGDPTDSAFMACLTEELFRDDHAGVKVVAVQPFTLCITHSQAVYPYEVKQFVEGIMQERLTEFIYEWATETPPRDL